MDDIAVTKYLDTVMHEYLDLGNHHGVYHDPYAHAAVTEHYTEAAPYPYDPYVHGTVTEHYAAPAPYHYPYATGTVTEHYAEPVPFFTDAPHHSHAYYGEHPQFYDAPHFMGEEIKHQVPVRHYNNQQEEDTVTVKTGFDVSGTFGG